MNVRAIIVDIYQTVLEVGPPPADAEARWQALGQEGLNAAPRLRLGQLKAACEGVIDREHRAARAAGISWPEIFWPAVMGEVLPELAALPTTERDEFLVRQQGLVRSVRLMPGAAAVLRAARERGWLLGIASNAQPYTLHELATALETSGLTLEWFAPELCFWSFAHGFSKPDPHVFRLLTARLRARGIAPADVLMVGDRHDNDIEPARAQGWRTWRLTAAPEAGGGDWAALGAFLADQG